MIPRRSNGRTARSERAGSPETLRPLSPYERLFWAIDHIHGFNFSVDYSLRGTVDRARWSAAFAQAQQRHPLFNAGLNLDDPSLPIFVRAANLPIPLTFVQRTSPTQWQRVMETEFAKLFDPSTPPFLRAVLLEDNDGCDLVLTANHIVLDGMGITVLVRDLFAALSGEKLPPLPTPPSADDHAARVRSSIAPSAEIPQASENVELALAALPARMITRRNGGGSPTITALRLSQQETAQLIRSARREQTTVGSVLLAALGSALRTLSPALAIADIRFTTPIDVRPHFDNAADFVLSISSARGVCPYPANDLWENARAIRSQLVAFQSFLEIEAGFNRVQALMALNLGPATMFDALANKVGHDLALSNLKSVDLPSPIDGLTVEAVWGPSILVGYDGEHMVGSATINGALHLLYTSHSPVTGLLERVQQILAAACADA